MNPASRKRFDSRMDKSFGPDSCWPWTAYRDADGYGLFSWQGHNQRAHRVAYIVYKGPIPEGMCVCHSCDNPRCCNPAHLWLGTNADNSKDRNQKGRTSSGERHMQFQDPFQGSAHGMAKLTEEQVLEIRRLYAAKLGRRRTLAVQFKVTEHTIKAIVERRLWRHI